MTSSVRFPAPRTARPCKRIRLRIAGATIVIPIIRGCQPIVERIDTSRECVTRLVAATLIRQYRNRR